MDIDEERIENAANHTEVLRLPRQSLSTFGITNIYYYLVTEPAYSDIIDATIETVIREGRVVAQRPRIVTPYYLSHLEGFSADAKRYFDMLCKTHGPDTPGLFYTYKNLGRVLQLPSIFVNSARINSLELCVSVNISNCSAAWFINMLRPSMVFAPTSFASRNSLV